MNKETFTDLCVGDILQKQNDKWYVQVKKIDKDKNVIKYTTSTTINGLKDTIRLNNNMTYQEFIQNSISCGYRYVSRGISQEEVCDLLSELCI